MASEMLLNIHLAELRERAELTQKEPAGAMGVKQPTIAGMEKVGQDIKLSSSGWNAAAYLGGEIKNPVRNIPLALFTGTALVICFYLFF